MDCKAFIATTLFLLTTITIRLVTGPSGVPDGKVDIRDMVYNAKNYEKYTSKM